MNGNTICIRTDIVQLGFLDLLKSAYADKINDLHKNGKSYNIEKYFLYIFFIQILQNFKFGLLCKICIKNPNLTCRFIKQGLNLYGSTKNKIFNVEAVAIFG